MSDISDLHGVYPTSLRWNAEIGILAFSVFNAETGERELREIELGQPATFALDLATRERGYGLIKTGVYNNDADAGRQPSAAVAGRRGIQTGGRVLGMESHARRAQARDQRGDLPAGR
jgi:hypothetical protein